MHYNALVIAPGDESPDAAVERLMAPHQENYDEAADALTGHWDWWVIGGRWTGLLTDYDPSEDPANIETCDLCGGTGDRASHRGESREQQHSSGCNGCLGKGTRLKWPTQWAEYPGDVATGQAALDADVTPYALVTPDGEFHVSEKWNRKTHTFDETPGWAEKVREALREHATDRVIVVDYHC